MEIYERSFQRRSLHDSYASLLKKRPVLILKAENVQGDFLAVQITSQPGYEGALILEQSYFSVGVLPKISFVRPDKLITLNKSLVVQRIGILTDAAFARIREGVCAHLGCEAKNEE